jgi:hypothetical protein
MAQEWYELYANGERALRNNQPQRAADLLQRAIQRRPQPGLAVPTYGTNFEPRYFPYLRLAEAYLRTEAFEEALKTLETSARFAVEPGAERSVLEARVRAGMDARRPPPKPAAPPASTPAPDPPPPVPPPTPVTTAPPSEAPVSAPGATGTAPSPSPAPSRPAEPALIPPAPAGAAPSPTVSSEVSSEVSTEVSTVRPAERGRPGPPALEITSAPPGAEVFVDDERVGRTDPETGRLRLTTLRPGRHRVRLSSEGRDDLMREIDLAGESLVFHAVLSLRTTLAPAPVPTEPTGQRWSLPRTPAVGLALGLIVAAALLLWFRGLSRAPTPADRAGTPAQRTGIADEGTNEGLPVDFGDYRLLRRIGKGGMASVYEAERRGERFALKRPLAGFLDDKRFIERFLREADLGRTLHHPNIVRIFDQGQVGPTPYFAMELIDGDTLRARLDRDGRLDPMVATRVTAQIAEALDYAHHKGIIHRDLKPSNIMFDRSGSVKVMDYGIARSQRLEAVTTVGSFLGTPHYAAPETVEAQAEPRSDIYSLGVVFFEMLTGSQPFSGGSAYEVLHNHCVTPPPTPSSLNYALPKELDRIVLRLLSKQPSDRPTAEELLNELADYLRRADEAV